MAAYDSWMRKKTKHFSQKNPKEVLKQEDV
jgi:hypothetical protein